MNRDDFVRASKEAGRSLAETAITTPYIFQEYAEWEGRKRELERATLQLAEAEAKWLQRLAPALEDPLLRKLAEQRGLLPPNATATRPSWACS